jgi:hypothetical protein
MKSAPGSALFVYLQYANAVFNPDQALWKVAARYYQISLTGVRVDG